jgi:hypothetical protein
LMIYLIQLAEVEGSAVQESDLALYVKSAKMC